MIRLPCGCVAVSAESLVVVETGALDVAVECAWCKATFLGADLTTWPAAPVGFDAVLPLVKQDGELFEIVGRCACEKLIVRSNVTHLGDGAERLTN